MEYVHKTSSQGGIFQTFGRVPGPAGPPVQESDGRTGATAATVPQSAGFPGGPNPRVTPIARVR